MNKLTPFSRKLSERKIPQSFRNDGLSLTVYFKKPGDYDQVGFTVTYNPDDEIYTVNGCYKCTGLGWAVGEGLFLSRASADERQAIMEAVGDTHKVTDLEALYLVLKYRLPVTYEASTSAGSERLMVSDTSILHRYCEAAYHTKDKTCDSARDALLAVAQHPDTDASHRYILLEVLDLV